MISSMVRYSYIKPRNKFGRQCIFEYTTDIGVENIMPDPRLMNNYVLRWHNNQYVQVSPQLAGHEAQTVPKIIKDTGILHTEGGWPKEINPSDNEVTYRYRRRVERSDNWVPVLKNIMPPMEHCVRQNGAMNIYQNFFDDLIPTSIFKYYNISNRNSYADPEKINRPVSDLSWSSCGLNRLAAAYSFMEFEEHSADVSPHSYIWDIEYASKIVCTLKSSSPLLSIKFNPRDPALLVGGLLSGQVCCWDIRQGGTPAQLSHPFHSHRQPVTRALWIPSKVVTEFFSASTDGTVKWWDTRYPEKPREVLVMDLDDPSRGSIVHAVGVTALQFEQSISSRFLAGLENGIIINVNRRSSEVKEKLASKFMGYKGPVIGIDRNPAFLQCFLTIGNGSVKMWADDAKEGCLFDVWEGNGLTGGCWSKTRCSVFFTINTKGEVKAYDILAGVRAPLTSIHPCQDGLTAIDTSDNGDLIAVGNRNGDTYVLQCSKDLAAFSKDERYRLNTHLERYARYEKAVDSRLREMRLMMGPDVEEDFVPKRVTKKEVRTKRESKVKKREHHTSREIRESARSGIRKALKSRSRTARRSTEPELIKAEQEYFRRIEAESALHTELDKEDVEAAQELLKERIVTPERVEEEEEEESKEETKKERKSMRRLLSRVRSRKEPLKATKELEREDVEDVEADTTGWTDTKKRPPKILKKICPEKVCKPEICCRDVAVEARARRLREAQDYKMTTRLPEKIRSTLIEDRFFRKLTVQLDDIPELSPIQKRHMLILKNAAPDILRKELQLAKAAVRMWQEIALAGQLGSWMVVRKLMEAKEAEKKEMEAIQEAEASKKQITEAKKEVPSKESIPSKKQTKASKDSIGRRRSMKRIESEEEEKRQEELRRQQLWENLKKRAKEHDKEELRELPYPRVSAAFVRTSSEELLEKAVEKEKSQVQIDS